MAKGKYHEWLTEEGKLRLKGWAMDGLTDEDIAINIGVGTSTFYEWKKRFKEIAEVLKDNKDVADRRIENALYKKALDGDTTAMIFWLKNRKPDKWRDRRDVELSGEIACASALQEARKRASEAK